jgi:hypothetical protein
MASLTLAGHPHTIACTTPPPTRSTAPLVAEASGLADFADDSGKAPHFGFGFRAGSRNGLENYIP